MSRQLPKVPDDNVALIATLGYSGLWFDKGLLTHGLLAEQYMNFVAGDDKHTEHYRYSTFRHYLGSRTHLTNEELADYLQVALAEPDSLMGGAAAKDLFTEISLTEQQFVEVCEKLAEFPGDWTAAIVLRQRMLRQIATGVPDSELFNECLAHGDAVVQKRLLQVANAAQLAALAIFGKTQSIRNMATEKSEISFR